VPLLRDDMAGARANLARLVEIMGRDNVFVEVMDHGIAAERKVIPGLVALSKEFGLPLVATNDSHYTNACDADAHDAWLAIGSSKGTKAVLVTDEKRFRFNGTGYHLRTAAEMHTLFDGQPGTEAAVANTLLIAERIENDVIPAVGFRLPHFAVPPGHTSQTFLYEKVKAGAVARYGSPLPQQVRHELRLELDVIDGAGLTDYILIVDDVIAEARRRGIRVGPGRGSGAGSRVLYCLGVTQVEPIAHGLLFERFLDPARPGMPDVDIDFQADRRDELYRYAADKYGVDYVARIGAVGMAWARKAIRSVGRVTAQDELADTLARLVPGSSASLASALDPAVPEGAALRRSSRGERRRRCPGCCCAGGRRGRVGVVRARLWRHLW
jgi:DNA polymerase-3 subunit alpha